MRKLLCLLLALALTPAFAGASTQEGLDGLLFAAGSDVLQPALLQTTLSFAQTSSAEAAAEALEAAGFTVVRQSGYDKAVDDDSPTCAYTIARQELSVNGERRVLLAVTVRGTSTPGEWMSNFDFAPSHSDDTAVAENFFFAAEAIYADLKAEIDAAENPLVLVTGYSRGAACANLLGVLLNTAYDASNVYVYTFATPTTMRGARAEQEYPNIFNIVNPADLATRLPLEAWGYRRPGTDIVLPAKSEDIQSTQALTATLAELSPSISSYYEDLHSLTSPGTSEQGVTVFACLQGLCASMMDETAPQEAQADMNQLAAMVQEDSDLAPLFRLILHDGESWQAGMSSLLAQHMPAVYLALLEQTDWDSYL